MNGRIIQTVGEPPTPPFFDSALKLSWQLCVSFSLQIEKQGLVEFDLSVILDPFDFNQFMLWAWAMSFSQMLSPAPFTPVSCSFPKPCPGPQCCLYNLLEGQPENSWPLGGKYCIILALQAVWAQTLTTLLLKLQAYSQIKSPLHFFEHLVCCLLPICS